MPIYYNTAPPTTTTKNTINSIMATLPNIRDFLLLKNLAPQYPTLGTTINGSPKIGQPVLDTMVGTGSITLPIGLPLETEGILWKEQNVLPNMFKNIDTTANSLMSIDYIPDVPFANGFGSLIQWPQGIQSYPRYVVDDVKKYGIFGKTVNAEFKKDNIIKNMYLDSAESKDVGDFIALQPVNVVEQVQSYIESYGEMKYGGLNLNGDNKKGVEASNIIGSITSGGGLGLAKGGVIPNFDVRSSLAGRVLGAAGLMKDTKLGMIGGQQLALALANNAAFNLQQDILGALNIQDNVLSLVKGEGFAAFPRPNYTITIPGGVGGRIADYTSKLLGFTIPRSYVTDAGSIFQSESGEVTNIDRANNLIMTTGKGQLQALIANINASLNGTSPNGVDSPNYSGNTFRSGYAAGYKNSNKEKDETTLTANMYAFQNGNGMVNLFNKADNIIPDLSYLREQKVTGKNGYGFEDPTQLDFAGHAESTSNRGYDDRLISDVAFSWGSYDGGKSGKVNSNDEYSDITGNKKSLLVKTQKLFNSVGMLNIVTAKGDMDKQSSQLTQANGKGFSKGNAVMKKESFGYTDPKTGEVSFPGLWNRQLKTADETYCRSWTTIGRYDSISKLVRNGTDNGTGLYSKDDGKVPFRLNTENTVLEETGFVHIAPYNEDFNNPELNGSVPRNVKNYMLSIENLAWHDRQEMLPKGELGQGDPITGKRGRMMWFPPYDIQISESTSVDWEAHKFIGRGENMYTYNNTERSGQLSFKIIVDHSTYTNTFRDPLGPDDHYVASFMAGCIEPDSVWTDKFTVQQISKTVPRTQKKPQEKVPPPVETPPDNMKVFFPNDNTNFDGAFGGYENGKSGSTEINYLTYNGKGGGIGQYRGKYTSKSYWEDDNNWGLNFNGQSYTKGPLTPSKVGDKEFKGFFSPGYYQALVDYLKDKAPHVNVVVVGYASDQGENTPNAKLAKDRAEYIRGLLVKNVAKPLGLTDGQITTRFKTDLRASVELQTFTPTVIDYVYNGEKKKVNAKLSANGCAVCPRLEKGEVGGISKEERKVACRVDTIGCKLDRFASITFEYDSGAALAGVSEPAPCIVTINDKISQKITQKFYNETMFFDKLKKSDKFIFDRFREKIKYFHPAFHSTTPEGLNSRLTFLQQCTRQGPTDNHTTNNLAFGRPPVCILRVGDFYNTKIIIDSLNIDYEPLVWDLNPEGIGVQPMIANVSLSFKFIGAESLYGPINKLQNALSFNYYANTGVYEARADYISEETPPSEKDGKLVSTGMKLNDGVISTANDPQIEKNVKEDSRTTICDENQIKANEKPASEQVTPEEASDATPEPKITGFDVYGSYWTQSSTVAGAKDYQAEPSFANKYFIYLRLKSEGIEEKGEPIISDDKLKEFVSKGIKIILEPSVLNNESRIEEIVKWDLGDIGVDGDKNDKNTWSLFTRLYNLGYECAFCFANETVVDLTITGNYNLSLYYNNEKIQTVPFIIGKGDFTSPNTFTPSKYQ